MGSSAGAGYDSQRGKRVKLSLRAWWLLGKAGHFSSGPKGTPWPCHYCLKPTLLLIALESDSWGKSKEEISSSVADLDGALSPFYLWEAFVLGISASLPFISSWRVSLQTLDETPSQTNSAWMPEGHGISSFLFYEMGSNEHGSSLTQQLVETLPVKQLSGGHVVGALPCFRLWIPRVQHCALHTVGTHWMLVKWELNLTYFHRAENDCMDQIILFLKDRHSPGWLAQ